MKLNIYEHRKVVKTYEVDEYDLEFGTLEDVAQAMKLDNLQTGTDKEIIQIGMNLVMQGTDTVKGLLKDIFEGITDADIRHTKVKDVARVLVDVVKYTIKQLELSTEKN